MHNFTYAFLCIYCTARSLFLFHPRVLDQTFSLSLCELSVISWKSTIFLTHCTSTSLEYTAVDFIPDLLLSKEVLNSGSIYISSLSQAGHRV